MDQIIAAEHGIRQLHARFIDAAWRQDGAAAAECFTKDGEWKIATMHMHGSTEIGETFGKLLKLCKLVTIIPGIPLLDIGDGVATGRVYTTEIAKLLDDSSALTIGVYYDKYVREGDTWRFRWRHFGLHYRGPMDLSAELVNCPDYGPFPAVPGDDEPTFTRRAPVA